jgi:hypothetical protein
MAMLFPSDSILKKPVILAERSEAESKDLPRSKKPFLERSETLPPKKRSGDYP